MTTEGSRLERFLASVARVASGTGLHPLAVLEAIEREARRGTSEGNMPNAYSVELSPADAGTISAGLGELRRASVEMLEDYRRTTGLGLVGPLSVEFAASAAVAAGTVRVVGAYRLAQASPPRASDRRATQALTRQRNRVLVVEGVGRVPLRHTPFVIGRSTDCDLTLLDFAVSRRHAVIEQASNGQLLIRDLGSRNKILVDGETADEVILDPGLRVTLGGSTLWLEEQR